MSKCHDKMTNKNAKNLNVNNHGKGAVGQKNRVLPGASKGGVGGQHYTPIFTTTFFRTLAYYSYLVIPYCPLLNFLFTM